MDYLKNKRVYLTGGISRAEDDGRKWREFVTPKLQEFDLIVDDPTKKTAGTGEIGDDKNFFKNLIKEGKYKECKEAFWPICRKDLRSVDLCDFLLFYYDPDVPLFGTIDEIVTGSRLQKKPVLMYVPPDKTERINPWSLILIKEECIFTDWNKLFYYLDKINKDGPKGSQTSYWTL